MRILTGFILFFVICCSGNGQTKKFLNIKGNDTLEFKTEQQTDFIKVSFGNKTIIDTYNRYDTTTFALKSDQIPKDVFKKTNLICLTIFGMECDYVILNQEQQCWTIKEIPSDIKELTNLEILGFSNNLISKIPNEILFLKKLRIIDFTDNALSDIDILTHLINLEELYLFGCNISKLPLDIGKLKRLKIIGLTGNPLNDIEIERLRSALPDCMILFERNAK
jgi:Leucine-rich repeat (LRR) protein